MEEKTQQQRKDIRGGEKKYLRPRVLDRKETAIIELGSNGIAYRGKSATKQHADKSSKRHSK